MIQVKYILNLRKRAATGQTGQVESKRWLALGSFWERVAGVQRERGLIPAQAIFAQILLYIGTVILVHVMFLIKVLYCLRKSKGIAS